MMASPPAIQKVLVALDGSPAAATALPFARTLAARLAARVEVVHCVEDPTTGSALEQAVRQALRPDEALQLRPARGAPENGILEAAADPTVVLLVLTTHGRVIEPGRHLGRTAEAVLAAVSLPVLLVRPEAAVSPEGQRALALRRWLVPLDGAPATAAALPPAGDLARRLGASVDLLLVAPPTRPPVVERGAITAPRYVDQPQHEWPQWVREVIDHLCTCMGQRPADMPVRAYLTHGEVGPAIVAFATTHEIDAIVLVRRSHLEPGRATVLRAVLEATPCPVLLIAAEAPEPVRVPEAAAEAAR